MPLIQSDSQLEPPVEEARDPRTSSLFSIPRAASRLLSWLEHARGFLPALVFLGAIAVLHAIVGPYVARNSPVLFFLYVGAMLFGGWCGYLPGILVVTLSIWVLPWFLISDYDPAKVNPLGFAVLVLISVMVSHFSGTRRRLEEILRANNRALDARIRTQTQALQAQLAELETLYAKIPAGIASYDTEFRYVRINEFLARINGLPVPAHIGRTFRELLPKPLADQLEPVFRRVLETGIAELAVDLHSPAPSDPSVEREWTMDCNRVQTEDGKVLGIQIVVHDVTEHRLALAAAHKTNLELMRANADLEQFAYSASHDLQEPLRLVSIFAQMLNKKYRGEFDAQGSQYLDNIVLGSKRMEQLIRGLNSYLRVTDTQLTNQPIETSTVVERCLTNLQPSIEGVAAEVMYDGLPAIRMQEVHVEQLFQNLISNAIKYRSEQKPEIRVFASRRDSIWEFGVQDNGIGIEPRYAKQIFGVFKRLHPADQYEGAGIGLAICHRIVERYGGRIWVESAEGKGSTFYFTVPNGH